MKEEVILVKFDAYHSNYIPYGLIYIAEILKKEGFKITILHNIYSKNVKEDILLFLNKIIETKPLFVGFSVITGRSVIYSLELSRKIKELDATMKVVWGGIHPTLMPEETLQSKYIDYVVCDEGEIRIKNLVELILGNKDVDLDGICYKKGEQLFINRPIQKVGDISKVTQVDWGTYDLKPYINFDHEKPKLSYITSRGCPYNCGFCVNESLGNNKIYRVKELDHVISDIEYFKKKYGITAIHFNDDNFFCKRERAFSIIKGCNLPYFAESRINYLKEDFVKELKHTKCFLLMCGAESGVQRVLRYIKKGITVEQIFQTAVFLRRYKIYASWSFVLGFPTETKEETKQSFDIMKKIDKLAGKKICKPGIYIPYPGTYLYREAIKYGAKLPNALEEWGRMERYEYSELLPWFDYTFYSQLLSDHKKLSKREKLISKYKLCKNIIAKRRYEGKRILKDMYGSRN